MIKMIHKKDTFQVKSTYMGIQNSTSSKHATQAITCDVMNKCNNNNSNNNNDNVVRRDYYMSA